MSKTNISNFIAYCETELDLHQKLVIEKKTDPNETFYKSLPLCIIDAVFSIGVKYTSVMKAEENFISYFNLNIDREYPFKNKEYTIDQFIKDMKTFSSFDEAAAKGFKNKQRTSSCNGILKAEACYLVAKVFEGHKINTLDDFRKYTDRHTLDKDILSRMNILRLFLNDMNPEEAMTELLKRMRGTKDNEEFLASMNR